MQRHTATVLLAGTLLLAAAACDNEPAASGPGAAGTGPEGALPMEPEVGAVPAHGAGVTATPAVPTQAAQTARALVEALARNDAAAAGELFLSREQFGQLFETDQGERYYTSVRQQFEESVAQAAPSLQGWHFVELRPRTQEPSSSHPEGASIGEARLTRRVDTLHDVAVIVRPGDGDAAGDAPATGSPIGPGGTTGRTIRIRWLLNTDQGWRIFSPLEFETGQPGNAPAGRGR